MRVLVNALNAHLGGGISYLSRQLAALAKVRPDWAITALAAPWNERAVRAIPGIHTRSVKIHSVAERLAYEQVVLPLRTRSADVLYCPGNFVPLLMRTPRIVAEQKPLYFGVGRIKSRQTLRLRAETALAKMSVRRAEAVVVISNALLREIERDGLAFETITVIQSGAPDQEPESRPMPAVEDRGPYFLSLANDSPHKRLDDLVLAWGLMPDDSTSGLVLAGDISPRRQRYHRTLVPPRRRGALMHLGPVEDRAEVQWLLETAVALVITSELEAFPLTPAEAGSAGCPLVLTDIPPHLEVTEGRGTYFAPGHVHDLTSILAEILIRPPARDRWRWPLTWEDNASSLAGLIESVVAGG